MGSYAFDSRRRPAAVQVVRFKKMTGTIPAWGNISTAFRYLLPDMPRNGRHTRSNTMAVKLLIVKCKQICRMPAFSTLNP